MTDDKNAQSRTADEVQNEIGHTRAELDHTLDEIGRRLSPAELRQQMRAYVGELVAHAAESARQNPAAVAAAALTVAGTVMMRHRRRAWERQLQAEQVRTIWDRLAQIVVNARDERVFGGMPLTEVVSKASDLAHRARASVMETAGDVAAKAQSVLRHESLGDLAKPVQRLTTSIEAASREHTLLSLALAVGAGAMISSLRRR